MMRPHGPWENGYYPVEKLTWFSDIQDLGEFHRGPVFGSDCTWTLTKHHSSELCCPYLQRVELEEEDYASKLQGKKTMAIPWEPNIIQGLSRYPAVYTWRNLTALWRWLVGEHWRWLIGEHWRWLIAVHWRWLIGEPWKWLFGEHWRCPSGNPWRCPEEKECQEWRLVHAPHQMSCEHLPIAMAKFVWTQLIGFSNIYLLDSFTHLDTL